ncbi:MAG: 3-hydroxyacyl-ACP dehydratase FabZ family protein [Planctomycetia bacterium]|nr:3-hydroxyacyl-ACP dehydratase FabZ family protein [Planctomycetia bacterium]
MRFILIDKITELKLGESITTTKNLSIAEEYLADHFPGFAVMPGVLMLEAMTQSAAWLIRLTDDFADSIISLKEARNVKYNHFVQPGETLTLKITILGRKPKETKVKAEGFLGDLPALSAKLTLSHHNVSDVFPGMAWKDADVVKELRRCYESVIRHEFESPIDSQSVPE